MKLMREVRLMKEVRQTRQVTTHEKQWPIGLEDRPDNLLVDTQRIASRMIQDVWLQSPKVQQQIACVGWNASIMPSVSKLMYRDVRDGIHPCWHKWMKESSHARKDRVDSRKSD